MDYGRFKYEQTKKWQEAKKKQTTFQVKEIKVRPKTDTHDLEIKIGHIEKFIGKKNKVKVTVVFRGREITLTQKARELLAKIAEDTKAFAAVEQDSRRPCYVYDFGPETKKPKQKNLIWTKNIA